MVVCFVVKLLQAWRYRSQARSKLESLSRDRETLKKERDTIAAEFQAFKLKAEVHHHVT